MDRRRCCPGRQASSEVTICWSESVSLTTIQVATPPTTISTPRMIEAIDEALLM